MELVRRVYNALTAPLYKRLLLELKTGIQAQLQTQLDNEASLLERLVDELSSINLRLDELSDSPSGLSGYLNKRSDRIAELEGRFSAETIYALINELNQRRGLHEVMHKYEISASDAVRLESKYNGMNPPAIERLKQTTKQIRVFEKELNRIEAYALNEPASPRV